MGWIENGPRKSGGDFLSVNSFPPKLKRYVLDLSVLKNVIAKIFDQSACRSSYVLPKRQGYQTAKCCWENRKNRKYARDRQSRMSPTL